MRRPSGISVLFILCRQLAELGYTEARTLEQTARGYYLNTNPCAARKDCTLLHPRPEDQPPPSSYQAGEESGIDSFQSSQRHPLSRGQAQGKFQRKVLKVLQLTGKANPPPPTPLHSDEFLSFLY